MDLKKHSLVIVLLIGVSIDVTAVVTGGDSGGKKCTTVFDWKWSDSKLEYKGSFDAKDFYQTAAGKFNFASHDQDGQQVERFLGSLPQNPSVLDAGSGNGRFIPIFWERSISPVCVDFSQAMLEMLSNQFAGVETHVANIEDLTTTFPERKFDGIIAMYSLIHMPLSTMVQTMREFHRLLNHDGKVLFAFQEGTVDHSTHSPVADELAHYTLVDIPQVRLLLERAGFKIISTDVRPPNLAEHEVAHNKLYVTAKRKLFMPTDSREP